MGECAPTVIEPEYAWSQVAFATQATIPTEPTNCKTTMVVDKYPEGEKYPGRVSTPSRPTF